MLSEPADLFKSDFKIRFLTPSSVTSISGIEGFNLPPASHSPPLPPPALPPSTCPPLITCHQGWVFIPLTILFIPRSLCYLSCEFKTGQLLISCWLYIAKTSCKFFSIMLKIAPIMLASCFMPFSP